MPTLIILEHQMRPHITMTGHITEQGVTKQGHGTQAEDVGGEAIEGEVAGQPTEWGWS